MSRWERVKALLVEVLEGIGKTESRMGGYFY